MATIGLRLRTLPLALSAALCVGLPVQAAAPLQKSGPQQTAPLRLAQHAVASQPADTVIAPAGSFSALPALLERARQLLPRQPDAAYRLLEPLTWDYAGSRDFDFLLGVAALDSKRPAEAVIALERVLDNHPDDVAARTELVRAYLALEEQPAAEQALRQLMETAELTSDAQQTIQSYLDIVQRRNGRQPRRWNFGLDLGGGIDSNVNVGSSKDRWLIDDGIVLTPMPASRPQRSPFIDLGMNFQYLQPLSDTLEWSTQLLAHQRLNAWQHQHDQSTLGASTGLAWNAGRHRLSGALNVQQMLLDQHRFRHASGVLGQWQFQASQRTQLGLYAQHFLLRFHQQHHRDARRTVLGATLAHALPDAASTVFILNPYGGQEKTRDTIPTLDFSLYGLRLGMQRKLDADWRGSIGLQWEERRHDGTDPLFGQRRRDRQFDLRLGAEHDLNKRWTLAPQLQYSRNRSTLAPSDFQRLQVQINFQYRY